MQRVSKVFKNLITFVSLGVIFMLFGIFFVGCGSNPTSDLTLSSSVDEVSLFVDGESQEVSFTIGNYKNSVDPNISFTLIDSTSISSLDSYDAKIESEHVVLERVSQEGSTTTVKLTGKSGGTTSLVARCAGEKEKSINIVVKQYASVFKFEDDVLLFVSDRADFIPNDSFFVFEDVVVGGNVTERQVSFYKTNNLDGTNDENKFERARIKLDGQGGRSVEFLNQEGQIIGGLTVPDVQDGQTIDFVSEYVNPQTSEVYKLLNRFTVISGFQSENMIEVKGADDSAVNEISIIANDTSSLNRNEVSLMVTVPYAGYKNAEDEMEDYVFFSASSENINEVCVIYSPEKIDAQTGKAVYHVTLSSNVSSSAETTLNLDVYYKFNGESFMGANDSSVHQHLSIPVHVLILPNEITINNIEQNSDENGYEFYNYYEGDYGWQEFKIDVFEDDSTFEHVLLEFSNDVVVRYNKQDYKATANTNGSVEIDDISQPVYIRGNSDPANQAFDEYKDIKFTVISKYILSDQQQLVYNLKYRILSGARSLDFDNPLYVYSEADENSGVFVSTSSTEVTFNNLITNGEFKSATITNSSKVKDVAQVIFNGKEDLGDNKFAVSLSIFVISEGDVEFDIILDNGVKLAYPFHVKVRRTFDDMSVNMYGTDASGVVSANKINPPSEGYNDEMELVIQNTVSANVVTYNRHATISISSTNGTDVFTISQVDDVDLPQFDGKDPIDVIYITDGGNGLYTLRTQYFGEADIVFIADGYEIGEDFHRKPVSRQIIIHVISFVPVEDFRFTAINKPSADSISLSVGQVSDKTLQTVTLQPNIQPSVAFGFYDPHESTYVAKPYDSTFIYWTINTTGINAYDGRTPQGVMTQGKIYRIGPSFDDYYGTLDLIDSENIIFTINPDSGVEFSVTLFAALRQYGGNADYYPITIKGEYYNNVQNIYTNLDEIEKIVFSPINTQDVFDVGVYLNPTSATDTNIIVKYISYSSIPLILESEIEIEKINEGIWHVFIKFSSEFNAKLNAEKEQSGYVPHTHSGLLQIIPSAWYSDGQIISGFESSIVTFDVAYEDGSEENPFSLSTPEELIKIGETEETMALHYALETTIDLSGYRDALPIGGSKAFTGSIKGAENAVIKGIVVRKGTDNQFGLFSSISEGAKITNISFLGSFDITSNESSEATLYIGLIAGKFAGEMSNIKVTLSQSSIVTKGAKIYVGGMFGQMTGGTLRSINVIYDDYLNVVDASGKAVVGGVIGSSTSGTLVGREEGEKLFGYASYTVYALISVRKEANIAPTDMKGSSTFSGTAAGLIGENGGTEMKNIIAGGEIFAQNAAGVVGSLAENTKFSSLTTRVFVRGKNIALFGLNVKQNISSDLKMIIEATDDGERVGVLASMGVMFADSTFISSLKSKPLDDTFIIEGNSASKLIYSNIATLRSYINRSLTSAIIGDELSTDVYYGDYIVIDEQSVMRVAENGVKNFDKQTTSVMIEKNDNFIEMLPLKWTPKDKIEKVIFMYYFEAAGKYDGNGYSTTDLQKAQEELDNAFNILPTNHPFYPIKLLSEDITLVSQDDRILDIDSDGTIRVHGTGIVEVKLSSLLNRNVEEVVYLYVVNYFDVFSYGESSLDGIFTYGNTVVNNGARIPVFSASSVHININPSYSIADCFKKGGYIKATISRSGLVTINSHLIQLKKVSNSMQPTILDKNAENALSSLNYGTFSITSDAITLSKKEDTGKVSEGSEMKDEFALRATLSCVINGVKYTHTIATVKNLTATYYEGAKSLSYSADNFVVYTSVPSENYFEIDSDCNEEELYFKVLDGNEDITGKLFKIDVTPEKGLEFKVKISLDDNSELFKKRYQKNIYKTYKLEVSCSSKQLEDGSYQPLEVFNLDLVQEVVRDVSVDNYPTYAEYVDKGAGEIVIPGAQGLLSIALTPYDADFEYITIRNNEINALEGASMAALEIGTMSAQEGQIVFVPFYGYEVLNDGVRMSKDEILNRLNANSFNGQIYVRYLFSNRNINDDQAVAFDVAVKNRYDDELIQKTYTYHFYSTNDLYVGIVNYPNKTSVARGLTYQLDVRAVGYDSVEVTSSSRFATIELREDNRYYLVISNDITRGDYEREASASSGGIDFEISVKAYKQTKYGLAPKEISYEMHIYEYVVNYDINSSMDIISDMRNGVITTPVNERKSLNVTFNGDIEYNEQNDGIASSIEEFLSDLRTKATWTLVVDTDANDFVSVTHSLNPENSNEGRRLEFSDTTSVSTRYIITQGYSILPLQPHDPQAYRHYYLKYEAKFKVDKGFYQVQTTEGTPIRTTIDVRAVSLGSLSSLNPVDDYDDFLAMEPDGYYILTNDIEVPSDKFVPKLGNMAYFDGNGYSFKFNAGLTLANNQTGSAYNYLIDSSFANIGLFSNIEATCLIQNISIVVGDGTNPITFKSQSTTPVSFGLVAGSNEGTISNAQVKTQGSSVLYLTFEGGNPNSAGYYFGGIAGTNSGKLTNSLGVYSAQTSVNMGGIVGYNTGHIASSAFREGVLTVDTPRSTVFGMGGLVAINSQNGLIMTSLTSGFNEADKPYSTTAGGASYISSSVPTGGFIFENEGSVIDCYSNLPISTSSTAAGFCYSNKGTITRSFSTSVLQQDEIQNNYYFAGASSGTFEDCYYLTGEVNKNLADIVFPGENPQPLNFDKEKSVNEFSLLTDEGKAAFDKFSITYAPATSNAVWYYSESNSGIDYFNNSPRVKNGDVQMTFPKNRIELVSANVLAYSQRVKEGEANTDGTYSFVTGENSPEQGNTYNPYVIFSPETMEEYISLNPSSDFRIAKDVDYSTFASDYSKLYLVDFSGTLEGNGLTISGLQTTSSQRMDEAGLFGSLAGSSSKSVAIMNLNLQPQLVTFTNSTAVGALCGRAENANIFNFTLEGETTRESDDQEQVISVIGKNVVGGMIGYSLGKILMKNIHASISAVASNVPKNNDANRYADGGDLTKLSYAGGIIGYAGGGVGNAKLEDMDFTSENRLAILGGKAGLMFGGLNASADNIRMTLTETMVLKPYQYGGLITGQLEGELQNAYVIGTTGEATPRPFALLPYTAAAVGGIVGIMDGQDAKISNAYMGQSFTTQTLPTEKSGMIGIVGGVVGLVAGSRNVLEKIIVAGSISANQTLGGVIGVAQGTGHTLKEIAVKEGTLLKVNGQYSSPTVGGMVGMVTNGINISDSYSRANISIDSFVYALDINAYFGGIVANASGDIRLNNIYTTSLYDITLQDLYVAGEAEQVKRCYTKDASGKTTWDDHYGIGTHDETKSWTPVTTDDGGATLDKVDDGNGTIKVINYTMQNKYLSEEKTADKENVFNSSILIFIDTKQNKETKEGYDPLARGFTSLKARKHNSDINVTQNEYGATLRDLNVPQEGEPGGEGGIPDMTLEIAFEKLKDIMKDKTGWTTNTGDFCTLAFETALLAQL